MLWLSTPRMGMSLPCSPCHGLSGEREIPCQCHPDDGILSPQLNTAAGARGPAPCSILLLLTSRLCPPSLPAPCNLARPTRAWEPCAPRLAWAPRAWPRRLLAALPWLCSRLFVSFSCQLSSPPAPLAARSAPSSGLSSIPQGPLALSHFKARPHYRLQPLSVQTSAPFAPLFSCSAPRVFFSTPASSVSTTRGKCRRNKLCIPTSRPAAGCQLGDFLGKGHHLDGKTLMDLPPPTDLIPLQPIYILGLADILW